MSTLTQAKLRRYHRRQRINVLAQLLSILAMVFGIFWLFWILFDAFRLGLSGMDWQVFYQMTPAPSDTGGGLLNAIMGSILLVALGTLMGAPIGIFTGIYLAEFGGKGFAPQILRLVNDVLLSAPSIVIGLFVYFVVVKPTETFSMYSGSIALALLVIPVVVRTTENMLSLVPNALREAAYALGTPKWKVILRITLRSVRAGVLTGVLLAVARIAGETAPLLFTALNNQFWSVSPSNPIASLPTIIFKFAMSPYENWQRLAWVAVLLLTAMVLLLNIIARYLTRVK